MGLVGSRHAVLLWNGLVTSLCCWFTIKTVESGLKSNRAKLVRDRSSSSISMRTKASAERRRTNATLALTSLSSISFTCSMVIYMAVYMEWMFKLYWLRSPDDWNDTKRDHRISENILSHFSVSNPPQILAYSTLSLVIFERLKMVFDHTPFMLSDRTVWICRSTVIGLAIEFLLAVLCFYLFDPMVTLILMCPGILIYPIFAVWISWKFFSNTRQLCIGVDKDCSDSMDLINVALRLSLSTFAAVLSTFITNLFWLLWLLYPGRYTSLVMIAVRNCDTLCNVFSLLCTTKDSLPFYEFVFGPIHRFLLVKIIDQES